MEKLTKVNCKTNFSKTITQVIKLNDKSVFKEFVGTFEARLPQAVYEFRFHSANSVSIEYNLIGSDEIKITEPSLKLHYFDKVVGSVKNYINTSNLFVVVIAPDKSRLDETLFIHSEEVSHRLNSMEKFIQLDDQTFIYSALLQPNHYKFEVPEYNYYNQFNLAEDCSQLLILTLDSKGRIEFAKQLRINIQNSNILESIELGLINHNLYESKDKISICEQTILTYLKLQRFLMINVQFFHYIVYRVIYSKLNLITDSILEYLDNMVLDKLDVDSKLFILWIYLQNGKHESKQNKLIHDIRNTSHRPEYTISYLILLNLSISHPKVYYNIHELFEAKVFRQSPYLCLSKTERRVKIVPTKRIMWTIQDLNNLIWRQGNVHIIISLFDPKNMEEDYYSLLHYCVQRPYSILLSVCSTILKEHKSDVIQSTVQKLLEFDNEEKVKLSKRLYELYIDVINNKVGLVEAYMERMGIWDSNSYQLISHFKTNFEHYFGYDYLVDYYFMPKYDLDIYISNIYKSLEYEINRPKSIEMDGVKVYDQYYTDLSHD